MVDKGKRPHIFGLTASPIHGMNDTETSFAQLEHNLDCKVVTVRNWAEVAATVPKCVAFLPFPVYPNPNPNRNPNSNPNSNPNPNPTGHGTGWTRASRRSSPRVCWSPPR